MEELAELCVPPPWRPKRLPEILERTQVRTGWGERLGLHTRAPGLISCLVCQLWGI